MNPRPDTTAVAGSSVGTESEARSAIKTTPSDREGLRARLTDLVLAPRWVFRDFLDNAPGWPDTARRYLAAPPAPSADSGVLTGVSLNGHQGEPPGMMTVTAHMSDGREVILIRDNGNVISHWKNTTDLFTPPSADSLADHLTWVLPMAKAYAAQNPVGSNAEIVAAAAQALARPAPQEGGGR